MLPKRKLIKKQYVAPKNKDNSAETYNEVEDIPSQLKSCDDLIKTDAAAAIANLPDIPSEITDPSCLGSLINLLHIHTKTSLLHMALYALINIFQVSPLNTVKVCFDMGLDKCLMALWNSVEKDKLLRPMVNLMTAVSISGELSDKYNEMMFGFQRAVFVRENLQNSEISQHIMQFLIVSEYEIVSNEQLNQKQPEIEIMIKITELDKLYRNRALAIRLICQITKGYNQSHLELFSATLDEFLSDLDLEQEYRNNVLIKGSHHQQHLQMKEQQNEDDLEEECVMKGKNHSIQFNEEGYKHLIDAMEGLQLMLEFCVDIFNENKEQFEDEDEQEEEMEEQMEEDKKPNTDLNENAFKEIIAGILIKNPGCIFKFTRVTFVEGNAIIELLFRLLLSLPTQILSSLIQKQDFINLTEQSIVNLCKMYAGLHQNSNTLANTIPKEIFYFNLNLLFSVILKYKQISNRSIYIQIPTLKFSNNNSEILPVKHECKQCWLSLLQIYSMFYNPEKFKQTSYDQNSTIGSILMHLLGNIPEMEMEEWRGQCIDTIFDVYSNEQFDNVMIELNYPDSLQNIYRMMCQAKGKSKKRNKFLKAVATDLGRFIEYKKKMCPYWHKK